MSQPPPIVFDAAVNASGRFSRRDAFRRLALVGLAAGASGSLLAACGTGGSGGSGSPPPPGRTPDTPRGSDVTFPGPSGQLRGSFAAPPGTARAAVLVVHDDHGLTPHYADLVGRFAGAGYAALCVDLLSGSGGAGGAGGAGAPPAPPADVPKALASTPPDQLVADLRAGIDELARHAPGAKVGAVGFGFGGRQLWQLLSAGEPRLAAVVPFYGAAPDNIDFSRSHPAVLGIYPDNDAKLNESQDNADQAMLNANLVHSSTIYEGTAAGFFDDTGPRYNGAEAAKAWQATLDWFKQYL